VSLGDRGLGIECSFVGAGPGRSVVFRELGLFADFIATQTSSIPECGS
jgi:hypothetical protein